MHQQIKKLLSERQTIWQNIMRNQLKKATDPLKPYSTMKEEGSSSFAKLPSTAPPPPNFPLGQPLPLMSPPMNNFSFKQVLLMGVIKGLMLEKT